MDRMFKFQPRSKLGKELLLNKVFSQGKIYLSLAPYEKDREKDMDHIILKDFPMNEKRLEEFIIKDIPLMGYTIIPSDNKWNKKKGVGQYKIPSGRLDILATDSCGNLIGFELSIKKENGKHLIQILSYIDDLDNMKPSGMNKIIMIAPDYSDRFVKIVEKHEKIQLWTYQMEIEWADRVTLVKGHEPTYNYIPLLTKEEARTLGWLPHDMEPWGRKGKYAWELAGMPEPTNRTIPILTYNLPFNEDLNFAPSQLVEEPAEESPVRKKPWWKFW